jgi:predicted SnoaL-like aldol condensation-catalyzing enzyme
MRKLIVPMALVAYALMLLPCLALADDADSRWLYQQRLEVGRALIEVQSTNWPSIMPYYADDIEYRDPVVTIDGIDQMTEFLARMFANSPDLVTTIEDETLSGRIYSATWEMTGQFAGVPYTAKGISIIEFRRWSAQVVYQRDYYSEGDIMASIPGLDQAVLGFRTFYRCAVDPTYECPLRSAPTDATPSFAPSFGSQDPDDSEESSRLLWWLQRQRMRIGRELVEINADNWTSLLRYYTDDYEYRDPIVVINGKDTLIEFFSRLFSDNSDVITVVEDESLQGNVYTATWTMTGSLDGVPYTAKGMSIVKFRRWSLKTYYSRDYYSEGDIMAGIPGLDEAIAGFRVFYRCAVDPTYECPLGAPTTFAGPDELAFGKSDTPEFLDAFSLQQNAPNPFNPATEISFVVPAGGASVSLRIYDVSGSLVRTLVDGHAAAGPHTVRWQGRDDRGQPVASGTYFYQLTAPSFSEMKKMVLLK